MADIVLVAAVVLVLILVYVGLALIRRFPGELRSKRSDRRAARMRSAQSG